MFVRNNPAGSPLIFIRVTAGSRRAHMSEQDLYIIHPSGEGWAVLLAHEPLGRFEERSKAIEAAVIVAEASARLGKVSGVVLDEGDERIVVWEAGRDAYSRLA
jgi:hypothetical protein